MTARRFASTIAKTPRMTGGRDHDEPPTPCNRCQRPTRDRSGVCKTCQEPA